MGSNLLCFFQLFSLSADAIQSQYSCIVLLLFLPFSVYSLFQITKLLEVMQMNSNLILCLSEFLLSDMLSHSNGVSESTAPLKAFSVAVIAQNFSMPTFLCYYPHSYLDFSKIQH